MSLLYLCLEPLVRPIAEQLHHSYFSGYPMDQVCASNFFHRFGEFTGHGLCYAAAATAMLALRDNHTARLVEVAYTDGKIVDGEQAHHHRWVEFRRGGIWWVLDPAWLAAGLELRRIYRRDLKAKLKDFRIVRTCSYEQFWSYPISEAIYTKMQRPKTSWLMQEIYEAYNRYTDDTHDEMFHPDIQDLDVKELTGTRRSPSWALGYSFDDQLLLTPRIVCELMARPTRLQPKAHTVRRAQSARRKMRYSYIQLLADTDKVELAQTVAAQFGVDYGAALRCQVPDGCKIRYTKASPS